MRHAITCQPGCEGWPCACPCHDDNHCSWCTHTGASCHDDHDQDQE